MVHSMDREKLEKLARDVGIGTSKHLLNADKKYLIREVQRALGQEPCYLTDKRYNCDDACEWVCCKKLTAAWLR